MPEAALFLIDGVEETEAIATADVLRRGGVSLSLVSLKKEMDIKGKHNIVFSADELFETAQNKDYQMLILPGGTTDFVQYPHFLSWLSAQHDAGKKIAAICAAPFVLAKAGLLKDVKVTAFPAEDVRGALQDAHAHIVEDAVVTDGNITTSRGPATALLFGVELLRILKGETLAEKVAKDLQLNWLLKQ